MCIKSVKNMQLVIFILLSKAIALDYNYNQFWKSNCWITVGSS